MKHPHLIYLSFTNQIAALAAVNHLPVEADLIEFGQLHAGQIVLIAGITINFLQTGAVDAADGIVIENAKPDLLKGYLRQLKTQVKANLLVVESPKLSQIFNTVDNLLKTTSYQLIEISRATGSAVNAVAYLTNGTTEEALMPAKADLHVRLFEDPTKHLLSLFNIK